MEILEVEPDIEDADFAEAITQVQGNIEFQNVSFRYKDNYGFVLKQVSLDIKPGEYVALVGPSGVGKTTLCSLIPRFYEVSEGRIMLDGRDIREITQHSLRKISGSCSRMYICLPAPSSITYGMATWRPARMRSSQQPKSECP